MTARTSLPVSVVSVLLTASPLACVEEPSALESAEELRAKPISTADSSYNVHLSTQFRALPIPAGADPDRGRALFGLAEDLETEDSSEALFEGFSVVAGETIVSNGRSCFTCHRGLSEGLGLPPPPLSDHVSLDDPLFTGLHADAQGDPDGMFNLDQLGLIKYRVNRFDPRPDPGNGLRQVFGWRKSIRLINTGLQQGFLNDMRGRFMVEVDRGAGFSHTQLGNKAFPDLIPLQDTLDLTAFQFTALFSPPELAAMRDPSDPLYETLVRDPYATVPVTTAQQEAGRRLFDRFCFGCHNMPNVFASVDNVEPLGNGDRPPDAPSWSQAVGRAYNIGVSERNAHGLRFSEWVGPGPDDFEPIVVTLAAEDGSIEQLEVDIDIGLAMTTGRADDVGRFKVPQLRGLAGNAPYFHDNSAATLAEVVEFFASDHYNQSKDGQRFPINLNDQQKADLIAFLEIL